MSSRLYVLTVVMYMFCMHVEMCSKEGDIQFKHQLNSRTKCPRHDKKIFVVLSMLIVEIDGVIPRYLAEIICIERLQVLTVCVESKFWQTHKRS